MIHRTTVSVRGARRFSSRGSLPCTACRRDFFFDTKKPGLRGYQGSDVEKALKLMETKGMAPIPGTFPIASSGKIIFRGYDGIYASPRKEDKSIDPPHQAGRVALEAETDNGLFQMVKELGPADDVADSIPEQLHGQRAAFDPD